MLKQNQKKVLKNVLKQLTKICSFWEYFQKTLENSEKFIKILMNFNAFAFLSKIYLLWLISISGINIKCKRIRRHLNGCAPSQCPHL